jgi:hypothetical protein
MQTASQGDARCGITLLGSGGNRPGNTKVACAKLDLSYVVGVASSMADEDLASEYPE